MAAAPKPEACRSISDVASGYEGALAAFREEGLLPVQYRDSRPCLYGRIRDDLADNCHYWMGESYYGMRKYSEAIEHFKMVARIQDIGEKGRRATDDR